MLNKFHVLIHFFPHIQQFELRYDVENQYIRIKSSPIQRAIRFDVILAFESCNLRDAHE